MQIISTTRRLRSESSTSHSIIEQNPALDDHAFPGLEAGGDNGLLAFLKIDRDRARLERPWRDLDEDAIAFVLEDQGGSGNDRHDTRRRNESDVGKHVRLQLHVWIRKGDANLGAAGVRVEHVADEEH